MRKRVSILAALALCLLVAFPLPVSAAIHQHGSNSCTYWWNYYGKPVPFLCLSDDINHSGAKLIFTGSSDHSNLDLLAHTPSPAPAARCSGRIVGDDDWNDCVSSAWAKVGNLDSACVYRSANYGGFMWHAHGGNSSDFTVYTIAEADFTDWPYSNDAVSSVMVQQSGSYCGVGGV